MSIDTIRDAAQQLSAVIQSNMQEQREAFPDDLYYVVVLVVTDDFETLDLYTNTLQELEERGGGTLDQWYFGQWEMGEAVEPDALTENLGEIEDFDDQPAGGNAVQWLAAMTEAMRIARQSGVFDFNSTPATLYCSMVDHAAAVWLEDLSARYLNDAEIYERDAPGIKTALAEWYTDSNPDATAALREEFHALLKQLQPEFQ